MPSEPINILIHGGKTRRMLTIEIGRNHKRGQNLDSPEGALEWVATWLGLHAPTAPVVAKCVRCGHNKVSDAPKGTSMFGICIETVRESLAITYPFKTHICGCKCKFAPAVTGAAKQVNQYCPYCHLADCMCSDFDVAPDMGARG